jgi:hypothetical protein
MYVAAWSDLGRFIEANSGAKGLARVALTGGRSILEAWFVEAPDKVNAIKAAEDNLKKVAAKYPLSFGLGSPMIL